MDSIVGVGGAALGAALGVAGVAGVAGALPGFAAVVVGLLVAIGAVL